jgi:WD40 repeat protein
MKRFILCTLLWSSFFFSSLVLADEPILVIDPQGHSAQITNVMFTPDGKTLVSISHDKAIRLWDVETGDLVKTIRGQIGDGPEGMLFAGALSPDGKILALGGFLSKPGDDPDKNVGQIRLFNVESGEQIGMLKGHENVVFALAFSQDGTWLASGSGDRTVRIWDISGRLIAMLRGHSAPVSDIAFSPDKRKFVSASFDRTLRLRELKKNLQGVEGFDVLQSSYDMEKHSDRVYCVAYAPDGKYLVSGGADGKILLWDGNGKFLKQIDQVQYPIATISFSADSQNIVTSGGTGKSTAVYVIPSGEKLTTFTKHTNTVEALAFYKNGLIATAGGNENDIYIWDASSGAVKTHIVGRGRWVLATAFDDHSRLAFGNSDKSPSDVVLHVLQDYPDYVALEQSFDFTDMSLNHEIPDNTAFKRVQTEYQGKTLERITNYELRITNGGTIRNDRGYDGQIRSYTFPKDGNVVVGSSYTLKLYQNDGMLLREFVGHTGEVWAVSVSEDGRILVSGSDDQTIKLWNLNTGECLATLFVASDNEWVCWTPQGYYAASAGGEKYIGWQINRGMDNAAEYYPVSVFRKQFLHPELVKRTISIGSFEQALKELNAESQQQIKETLVTQVLPSKAQWISPEAGTIETLDSAVRIRAEIDSESKLTDVRVLVNGRPCPEPVPSKIKGLVEGTQATGRGLALGTEDAEIDNMIDREISLTPGNNEITIFAANENAGAMSAKRIVVYRAEGYLPNLYMVSIGISQYQQSELQLEYADDDAKAMSRLFLGQEGAL